MMHISLLEQTCFAGMDHPYPMDHQQIGAIEAAPHILHQPCDLFFREAWIMIDPQFANGDTIRGCTAIAYKAHQRAGIIAAAGKGGDSQAQINVPLAKAYAREFAQLAKQLKITGPMTLDMLLRAPGAFPVRS